MTQVTFYRIYDEILLIFHLARAISPLCGIAFCYLAMDLYFAHKKASEINSEALEASTGIEPVIEVLQTFALPLGYDAIFLVTPTGIEPVLPP